MVFDDIEYKGEFFFVFPKRDYNVIADTTALRMLNGLHSQKFINKVLLRHSENYPSVEIYCNANSIEIASIRYLAEILKEADKSPEFTNFAYISRADHLGSLQDIARELEKRNFYVESRIRGFGFD